MGRSKSCVDCTREVPTFTKIRLFNIPLVDWCCFRSDGRATGLYKFFSSNTWIKLGDSGYLCPYCLDRRVENERSEEEFTRSERAAEEARQRKMKEEQSKREEEEQRKMADQRKREEQLRLAEQRRREEEQQQRKMAEQRKREEQRRREEEEQIRLAKQRKREEEQRRIAEQRRREEQQQQQRREEEEQRKREEEEEQRRLARQRRREEEQRRLAEQRRREEEQRRLAEQRRRQEEQRRREEEEEQQRKIAEQRRRQEEQRTRQEEEQQRKMAEQRKRDEEMQRRIEEMQRRIEEMQRRDEQLKGIIEQIKEIIVEDQRKREEERRREEEQRRGEELRRREEEQKRDEQLKITVEQQRLILDQLKIIKEDQRKRQEERSREEEQRRGEELKRREEEQRVILDQLKRIEEDQRKGEEKRSREEEQRRREEQRRDEQLKITVEQQRLILDQLKRKEEEEDQRKREEKRKEEDQRRREEQLQIIEECLRRMEGQLKGIREEQRKSEEQLGKKEEEETQSTTKERIMKGKEKKFKDEQKRKGQVTMGTEQNKNKKQRRRTEEQKGQEEQRRRDGAQEKGEEQLSRRETEEQKRSEEQKRLRTEEQKGQEEQRRRDKAQEKGKEQNRKREEEQKRGEEQGRRPEEQGRVAEDYIESWIRRGKNFEHNKNKNKQSHHSKLTFWEKIPKAHEKRSEENLLASEKENGKEEIGNAQTGKCNIVQQSPIKRQEKRPKNVKEIMQEIYSENYLNKSEKDIISILDRVRTCIKKIPSSKNERQKQLYEAVSDYNLSTYIAHIRQAVKRTKDYWPRDTQLVSVCLLIKSLQKGRLLEIKTGEGKSCIIAMFAVFLALSGRSVDIVTSSPILAVRDAGDWCDFYKQFEIEVDCNLIPKENEDRLKCYKKPVVYGTVGSFASDILRQEFLMEDVRGDRKCDAVIVDEVDSMLLDQGVNFTYLSSPAPGMHHIQPILLMIWNEVIRHPVVRSDLYQNFFVGKQEPLHVVLSKVINLPHTPTESGGPLNILFLLELVGVLRKGFTTDVKEQVFMNQNENSFFRKEMTKEKMLDCLLWVEFNFNISIEKFEMQDESTIHKVNQDHDGKQADRRLLIVGEGMVCVLYQDKKTLCDLIRTKIESFLTTECQNEEDCRYEFPSYLSEFVVNRLPKWIDNAFLAAISMKQGREYLIKDQEIVPVDFESTGVVELNTKWKDGLHQFLELKHQKKLSQMTLVTNFMSNQAFFKRYPGKLFGLSGTLGNKSELAFLQRYYGLSYLRIPTSLQKRFSEEQGIQCSNKDKWLKCIKKKVEKQTSIAPHGGKRAALIICEDINTAKEVKESLATLRCNSVTLFTENEEKDNISGKKLTVGDVIIATNIAGRGTDIEIDQSVVKAGGLFVLVTFLPSNLRVENQVFGRCARKGQPGSAQLVINKETLPLYLIIESFSDILDLKKIREENAERRQEDNETALFSSTIPKEKLFSFYCQFIRDAVTDLNCKDVNEKQILLNSMHEFWGLWLKMNCEDLKDLDKDAELEQRLNQALQNAKRQVMDKTSPCANLYHIIKLANEQRINKKFAEAEKLYTKAIETDKTWAAVAYYNRAYCRLLQRKDGYMEAAISDFKEAKKGFLKFNDEVVLLKILLRMSPQDINASTTTTMSQFDTRGQILNFYEENIDKALKKLDELIEEEKDAKAVGHNALTIALGDDRFCKKLDSELHVFCDLGLTEIVSAKEKPEFSWEGALVVCFGALEIGVGLVLSAYSCGLLGHLSLGLLTNGIKDACDGVFKMLKGEKQFLGRWLRKKTLKIGFSILSQGFSEIVSGVFEGLEGMSDMLAEVIDRSSAEPGTVHTDEVLEFGNFSKPVSPSESLGDVFIGACKDVAKSIGDDLVKRKAKRLQRTMSTKLQDHFEKETRNRLQKKLKQKMKNNKFKDSLKQLILEQLRNQESTETEVIKSNFWKIVEELKSRNFQQLRQELQECVGCLVNAKKYKLKKTENKDEITASMLQEFSEHFLNIPTSSNEAIENLATKFCDSFSDTIQEIFQESAMSQSMPDDECVETETLVNEISESLRKDIEDYITGLIISTLNSFWDAFQNEFLQKDVDGMVSTCTKGLAKGTMKDLLSISSKYPQLRRKPLDKSVKGKTVLNNANAEVETLDEKAKQSTNYALTPTRKKETLKLPPLTEHGQRKSNKTGQTKRNESQSPAFPDIKKQNHRGKK